MASLEEAPTPIPGYAGYGATRDGTIWSCWQQFGRPIGWKVAEGKWRPLAVASRTDSYLTVAMWMSGKRVTRTIHRLILITFVSGQPEGCEACHGNGVRTDNRLENLRWDTRAANQRERRVHGTDMNGSKHPKAKLTESDIPKIFESQADGVSVAQIGRDFGVSHQTIRSVLRRETWKYADERSVN